MEFYTNVAVQGKNILHRGYDSSGNRAEFKTEFRPTLYVSSASPTSPFRTINGKTVEEIQPGTIPECRDFMKQYEHVQDYPIYGNTGWVYQYISSLYKKSQEAEYDFSKIKLVTLDIEVESEDGFPSIEEANEKINVVTLRTGTKKYVLGTGEFSFPEQTENFYWKKCSCEDELLHDFIEIWREIDPDIATGWNVRIYDFPYIINRIIKILGVDRAKKLSPWGSLQKDKVEIWGKECEVHKVVGVSILDYYELYRKYTYSNQESYKLGHIASVELGKDKLDYSEFESLKEFYTKNFQKFVEYNIHDVDLVHELDEKMKLIELQLTVAYKAKINYEDAYSPIRTWDTIIYNYLKDRDTVIPQRASTGKSEQYIGAYVKDPLIGFHDWVVSYDAESLYPNLIREYNLGPDTLVIGKKSKFSIEELLDKTPDLNFLKTDGECMAANGYSFRKDKKSFLADIVERTLADRKKSKKLYLENKKLMETAVPGSEEYLAFRDIAKKHDIQQQSQKILANSLYGGIGNNYGRWYDVRIAEAITVSGQYCIRWVQNHVNVFLNKLAKTENIDYCIASDTDSVILRLGFLVSDHYKGDPTDKTKIVNFLDKFCKEILTPFIEKKSRELADYTNAYTNALNFKREVIADRGLWTAKKRYCLNVYDSEGVRYEKPKLKIMGIEVQRSSTPKICRDKLKESIRLILTADQPILVKYINEFKKEFYQSPIEDISFPRGVNKLEEYSDPDTINKKSTPIAVKGALFYNHLLKKHKLTRKYEMIRSSDKVKFLYLREPNPVGSRVISFSGSKPPREFNVEKYIDYDTQFEKSFLDPLYSILDAVHWKHEEESTLESFFGI